MKDDCLEYRIRLYPIHASMWKQLYEGVNCLQVTNQESKQIYKWKPKL